MPPLALVAALGVLAFLAASRKESGVIGKTGNEALSGAFGRAAPPPTSGKPLALPAAPQSAALGFQSLDASEKVQLFSELPRRLVIEGGKVDGAEALYFESRQKKPASKSAPALDVLYGANMGVGLPEKLAILVGKVPGGRTVILAEGSGWQKRVHPGSFWNVFLRPGEAMTVAKAAKVPYSSAAVGLLSKGAAALLDAPGNPVVRTFVQGVEDLHALLTPVAGFIDETSEERATTPADRLPDPLAAIRDAYAKANGFYLQNDVDGAKSFAPSLAPAVHPLREAGYALASAQVQALLAKVGAPIDV
jgi:hypothetical protein